MSSGRPVRDRNGNVGYWESPENWNDFSTLREMKKAGWAYFAMDGWIGFPIRWVDIDDVLLRSAS